MPDQTHLSQAVVDWLAALEHALTDGKPEALSALFVPNAHWRDLVAFTWAVGNVRGAQTLAQRILAVAPAIRPGHFALATGYPGPRQKVVFEREVIEAFFEFETAAGRGVGVVRLVLAEACAQDVPLSVRGWLLLTTLQELWATERESADVSLRRYGFERADARETWAEHRFRKQAFGDRDPEVLIVGGGHSGVMLAARLGRLHVDALVIDRLPRVGDVWRTRYESLALHTPTATCSFPYLPFPDSFPRYLPKDKVADWIASYVTALDLNFWTSTELVKATYDVATEEWRAVVRSPEGTREMRPKHVVVSIGAFGTSPRMPEIAGLADFRGQVLHTSHFRNGRDFARMRVLVIGVGTSAHDVALDITAHGGQVTMLQRGPVTVVRLETIEQYPGIAYAQDESLQVSDLLGAANLVFPLARDALRKNAELTAAHDQELIRKLEAAGMRIDMGPDGTGWQMKGWRTGSGYYIDVGASEVIASGRIKLLRDAQMSALTQHGVRLATGEVLDFDAVILATGYENVQTDLARIFGQVVAERVGPVFRLDDYGTGEWTNAWTPTTQPGLWFMVGGFLQSRPYSLYLALQLKARLAGLVDASGPPPRTATSRPRRPDQRRIAARA